MPMRAQIAGYANKEATAIAKLGRIMARNYIISVGRVGRTAYMSLQFGAVIKHGNRQCNNRDIKDCSKQIPCTRWRKITFISEVILYVRCSGAILSKT